jgi:ribosome biogenesis GTPase
VEGIITKGVGGAYTVNANGEIYTCTARGVFRNRKLTPLVGDRVEISITDTQKKIATLHTIKPRLNELRRPPAANITQVIITVATTQPTFNAGLLDRFLLLVGYEKIPMVICVNKMDLSSREIPLFEKSGAKTLTFEDYEKAGYSVVYASATEGDGLEDLRKIMAGKINLFAGPSGVGKSSLINALLPEIKLKTGELSGKIGRGKHTTRHTEIFALGDGDENGFCFDTPGFTSLDIEHIPKGELAGLFREFAPFAGDCKFKNCMHVKEKDCGVKAQIGQKIHPARFENYVKFLEA